MGLKFVFMKFRDMRSTYTNVLQMEICVRYYSELSTKKPWCGIDPRLGFKIAILIRSYHVTILKKGYPIEGIVPPGEGSYILQIFK